VVVGAEVLGGAVVVGGVVVVEAGGAEPPVMAKGPARSVAVAPPLMGATPATVA
jgi:hypothetical protein